MLNYTLRQTNQLKNKRHNVMLGYSCSDLKMHIESLFEPWMNWHNMGNHYTVGTQQKWSIDHIKPISQFIKEDIYDISIINALSNLRPLDARENQIKNNKYNINTIT